MCGCVWSSIIFATILHCLIHLHFAVALLKAVVKPKERVNNYVNEQDIRACSGKDILLVRAYLRKSYVVGGILYA